MLQPLFNNQVGRRLLLRFVLAALLPMSGVVVFAYFQIGNLLVDLNYRRLQQDSRSLGMSFIASLNWRAEALQREAARLADEGGPPDSNLDGFVRIERLQKPRLLNNQEAHHMRNGRVVLRASGGNPLTMLARIPGREEIVSGTLDPRSLWLDEEAPEHYCVVGTNFKRHFCTPELHPPNAETWPTLMARRNLGVFDWRIRGSNGETAYLAGFWRANLRPAFAHDGFIIMVADSKAAVLKGLERFNVVFPALILAAMALASLLAINQIRRQIRPLERLSEGTRQLAKGDFDVIVQAEGDDEFAALAGAFNQMSGKLRNKFQLLKMLSALDQAILGATDMEHLLHSTLDHIHDAIPCDSAGLLRFNDNGMVDFSAAPARPPGMNATEILECLSLDDTQPWRRIDLDAPRAGCVRRLFDPPTRVVLLFPIRAGKRLETLLILGYETPPDDIDEILAAGRGIADRLAVAASNLAWEEKLYHQAHYDALTNLPNRALLRDRVEQALSRADREQHLVAAMLLDLDSFKQVNDTLGHSAGDALLIECARRLRAQVRQSDTVARLGGDEFIILLPDLPRGGETALLDAVARKLNQYLAEPMLIADRQITNSVSIGIAIYPDNAGGGEDLLKMADAAMYESKRRQRGGFRFYSAEMNAQATARFDLAQDLREAVAHNELTLYYQPKVELASGRIVGAEALVRWLSPKRGVVPPGHFVPLLGEMGLNGWLDDWVLESACAQMAAWDRAGLPAISVSVNMSPENFQDDDLPSKIRELLARHELEHPRLELEILEATAVSESSTVHDTLLALRGMAVGIALDDFGTGYSSLVYLTRLPANVLKLDRAFIGDLATNPRQQAIVERIIALAKSLDFLVTAEGVEDEDQRNLLAGMDCDWIQGYLISPPLPAESFVHHWREHEALLAECAAAAPQAPPT
ncbi:MAG: EAL domain-containing protein [Pseudomonadota bacterium]|nr:EAL domain-containing protein [Pseudomonadota bacterium]MDP1903845.1 EAL domain-containing protein [Pseudomonadota bacterium]MDP2353657.1 EAL domain-containing protein [Pseudomonadota bacterium]